MTSRAELLERCQAAGLKATAWKKERMEEELARLSSGDMPVEPGVEPEAEVEPREPAPSAGTSRLGWCQSGHHADGRPLRWSKPCPGEPDGSRTCGCWCHLAPDLENTNDHRVVPKKHDTVTQDNDN